MNVEILAAPQSQIHVWIENISVSGCLYGLIKKGLTQRRPCCLRVVVWQSREVGDDRHERGGVGEGKIG